MGVVSSRFSTFLLFLTVLLSGVVTLGIELSASRLLGSAFGTGNLVWASVIGLVLLYLAAGYFYGGRLADRSPAPLQLYGLVAWAGLLSGLVPYMARVIVPAVGGLSLPLVVAVPSVVMVLFAVPVSVLGCVPLYAIRLVLVDAGQAGRYAGQVYAWSTVGSVLGALVPVLYMLPVLGVTATFGVLGGLLLAVAILGVWVHGGSRSLGRVAWMPVLLLLVWGISVLGGL
ncbi:MAG: fused MFS/spermidine synthase [Anaerolineae bacterium]|nr:fused MFS/spermidine synthase [Anaerolineae bacterium]